MKRINDNDQIVVVHADPKLVENKYLEAWFKILVKTSWDKWEY